MGSYVVSAGIKKKREKQKSLAACGEDASHQWLHEDFSLSDGLGAPELLIIQESSVASSHIANEREAP